MRIHEHYKRLGYEQLTVGSSTALNVPNGSVIVLLQAEGANIRWRDDGTAPTAAIGMRLLKDQSPFVYTGPLEELRFIQEASGAKLNVAYYYPDRLPELS